MGKNGEKSPIRYVSIGEAIRRTRIHSVKRLLPAETGENWYPDYVSHYELHGQFERREAVRRLQAQAYQERARRSSAGVLAGLAEEGNIVWVGDELAVRLDESRAELAPEEHRSETREGGRRAASVDRSARAFRFTGRRSPDRFAVAAAAAGILAIVLAGSVFDLSTGRRNSELATVTRELVAGTTPFAEIEEGDHLEPVAFTRDFGFSLHRRFDPNRAEETIRESLSVRGFYDIGVSAGKMGDVYLAGKVYSKDEADEILKVARRAMPSAQVHFLHPEIHAPTGPAYFGANTTPEDDVLGAKITSVTIGSPAYLAGIRPGDVVRGFDGELIPDADTFEGMLADYHPGDRVVVRLWRNGGNQFVVVRMADLAQLAML
jgi:PDZ domain